MIHKLLCAMSVVIGLVSSGHAFGQAPPISIEVIPFNPHAESPIILRIGIDRCYVAGVSATYTTPTSIRIDMAPSSCPGLILGPEEFPVGRLAMGAYTVDVYYGSLLMGSVTFSVVAAPAAGALPVPTLSEIALIGLALLVGLFGTLRRPGRNSRLPMVVSFCLAFAASLCVTSPGGG